MPRPAFVRLHRCLRCGNHCRSAPPRRGESPSALACPHGPRDRPCGGPLEGRGVGYAHEHQNLPEARAAGVWSGKATTL